MQEGMPCNIHKQVDEVSYILSREDATGIDAHQPQVQVSSCRDVIVGRMPERRARRGFHSFVVSVRVI